MARKNPRRRRRKSRKNPSGGQLRHARARVTVKLVGDPGDRVWAAVAYSGNTPIYIWRGEPGYWGYLDARDAAHKIAHEEGLPPSAVRLPSRPPTGGGDRERWPGWEDEGITGRRYSNPGGGRPLLARNYRKGSWVKWVDSKTGFRHTGTVYGRFFDGDGPDEARGRVAVVAYSEDGKSLGVPGGEWHYVPVRDLSAARGSRVTTRAALVGRRKRGNPGRSPRHGDIAHVEGRRVRAVTGSDPADLSYYALSDDWEAEYREDLRDRAREAEMLAREEREHVQSEARRKRQHRRTRGQQRDDRGRFTSAGRKRKRKR